MKRWRGSTRLRGAVGPRVGRVPWPTASLRRAFLDVMASPVARSAAVFLIAGLVFAAAALARAADAAPQSQSAADAKMMRQSDFDALRSIPLSAIIERAAGAYTLLLPTPEESAPAIVKQDAEKARARIDALDPDLRRLVWLTWILRCWGPDENEGLHTFFYLWGGDYAPQTLNALVESGLSQQAGIFRVAMAAFGPTYPTDRKTREQFFAWSQPATRIDETTSIPQPPQCVRRRDHRVGRCVRQPRRLCAGDRRRRSQLAWTPGLGNSARDTLSDDERLGWLTGRLSRISPKTAARQIATWPAAYRQLYLLDLFNGEMLNGGVHQFFAEYSPAIWRKRSSSRCARRPVSLCRRSAKRRRDVRLALPSGQWRKSAGVTSS